MKSSLQKITLLFFSFFFITQISITAQVRLPKLVSDGMVLQRDAKIKIWGWASSNEKITVHFLDHTLETTASGDGEWAIQLPEMQAGGPHEMHISSKNQITINNILIGDVWICSGQSNMELPVRRVRDLYESEIAAAKNAKIRQFNVPQIYNFQAPQKDFARGEWVSANPKSVLEFTAVGYFFAKSLFEKYGVPIGLINNALGGSPAESWMSEDALKAFPTHLAEAQKFKSQALIDSIEAADHNRSNTWYHTLDSLDLGHQTLHWAHPKLDDSEWKTAQIPGMWTEGELKDVNGVVWYRKTIDVPESMAGEAARLDMGRIVDADSVFVNGMFVGNVTYQYPPRINTIPEGVLKNGKNQITVRVISNIGTGGFIFDKNYQITEGSKSVDLTGEWRYKIGTEMEPLQPPTFIRWKPIGLYNGLLAPIFNYQINGVIWYQGESNAGRPIEYRTLFPAMIRDWRASFSQGDFPFLFVQLANFMESQSQPDESDWAMLREAQTMALSEPKTAMAVTIDIGEWNDIHPLNKKDIGERLSVAAQKVAYGEEVVYAGPTFDSIEIKGEKIELSFKHVGGGLAAKGGELKEFAIAGADCKYKWANAEIMGDKIVVWHKEIKEPKSVRYAWADNPEGANLYNKEGLPAVPFRAGEDD